MIDMDDVIIESVFLVAANKFLNTDYKEEEIKKYYFQELVPENRREDYYKYLFSENRYYDCKLRPYAYEVLEELNKKYNLCIGTAYIIPDNIEMSKDFLMYKYEYLNNEFPFLNLSNFVFANNKRFINCEIKVDDRIDNLEGAERKILFTTPFNSSITDEELKEKGVERANSWLDIREMLL